MFHIKHGAHDGAHDLSSLGLTIHPDELHRASPLSLPASSRATYPLQYAHRLSPLGRGDSQARFEGVVVHA